MRLLSWGTNHVTLCHCVAHDYWGLQMIDQWGNPFRVFTTKLQQVGTLEMPTRGALENHKE